MAFVEFTTPKMEGGFHKISINEDAIGYFEPSSLGTSIYITGGDGGTVHVRESYDEVVKLINPPADF